MIERCTAVRRSPNCPSDFEAAVLKRGTASPERHPLSTSHSRCNSVSNQRKGCYRGSPNRRKPVSAAWRLRCHCRRYRQLLRDCKVIHSLVIIWKGASNDNQRRARQLIVDFMVEAAGGPAFTPVAA